MSRSSRISLPLGLPIRMVFVQGNQVGMLGCRECWSSFPKIFRLQPDKTSFLFSGFPWFWAARQGKGDWGRMVVRVARWRTVFLNGACWWHGCFLWMPTRKTVFKVIRTRHQSWRICDLLAFYRFSEATWCMALLRHHCTLGHHIWHMYLFRLTECYHCDTKTRREREREA